MAGHSFVRGVFSITTLGGRLPYSIGQIVSVVPTKRKHYQRTLFGDAASQRHTPRPHAMLALPSSIGNCHREEAAKMFERECQREREEGYSRSRLRRRTDQKRDVRHRGHHSRPMLLSARCVRPAQDIIASRHLQEKEGEPHGDLYRC